MQIVGLTAEEMRDIFRGYETHIDEVMAKAANRAVITARKTIAQEIRRRYYVRTTDINNISTIKKASRSNPVARLTYKSSHLNLMKWNDGHGKSIVSRSRRARKKGATNSMISTYSTGPEYYKARVEKGKSYVSMKSSHAPKPFVQISTKTHQPVMLVRTDKEYGSYPRGVAGPDYTQLIKNKEVRAKFTHDTEEMMRKRVLHEIDMLAKRG